jgi:hypothetical protein
MRIDSPAKSCGALLNPEFFNTFIKQITRVKLIIGKNGQG